MPELNDASIKLITEFEGFVPNWYPDPAHGWKVPTCCYGHTDAAGEPKYAATKGVVLALENHGGITATPEQMLKIIDAVDSSPWFGVNFDGGNFRTDDPYASLSQIAPYAKNAQIKVEMFSGAKKIPADLSRVVQILRTAGYRGYVALEYEAAEDPFVAIPGHLAELRMLLAD